MVHNNDQAEQERIAGLRVALIRAHPDHGGTTASLQAALAELRSATEPAAPPLRATADYPVRPRPGPVAPTARRRSGPSWSVVSVAQAALRAWAGAILASMGVLLALRAVQLLLGLR